MAFYEEIAKYYDYIFPVGKEQVGFICEVAGNPPKSLLDVACGTGGYSVELAKLGYEVTAVDIDAKMIEVLKNKLLQYDFNVNCIQAGMLELTKKLNTKFDLVFCIGNSIVHLDGKDEIKTFFKIAKELLNKDGNLIIQTMNFDRVLLKEIKELPVIANYETGLIFKRYYRLDKENNKVYFRTILTVKDNKIENEIPLFPLLSEDIVEMLKDSGFKKVKLFGDFTGNGFDKYNSYMLVILAS